MQTFIHIDAHFLDYTSKYYPKSNVKDHTETEQKLFQIKFTVIFK